MAQSNSIFYTLAALAFIAGTQNASAAGFVKNADVGGYKVVVEGGGVDERKEIQYDSNGKVIYDSENNDLKKLFGGGENLDSDASLFGGGEGWLQLENVTLPAVKKSENSAGTPKLATPLKQQNKLPKPNGASSQASIKNPSPAGTDKGPRKLRSPWARSLVKKLPPEQNNVPAKKTLEKADTPQKDEKGSSIFIDPKSSLLQQPTTEDGRKMPFYIGQSTNGKEQIDPNSSLKNFMQLNDSFTGTREFGDAKAIETTDRYQNIISMEQWHSKFSSLGGKKVENYQGESAFAAKQYSGVKTFERNIIDNNLVWSHSKTSQITVNSSLAQKIIEKYSTGNASAHNSMQLATPGESNGISMQSINRYQFRRSHSDDPGLPVISPGGNGVKIKK